jgi:Predicted polymerase, most proteins contain PALM domain, HD hydrolase domain and Zn-ribbon domain
MEPSDLESLIGVTISPDNLSAALYFHKAVDDFRCTAEQLDEYLRSRGIVFGIRRDVLEGIARNPKAYFYSQTVVAAGQPPIEGKDGAIRLVVDLDEDERRPVELEDGTVDFKELTKIRNVKKGQLIAERVPAEPGIPGKAVNGEVLPAKNGKEARFRVGKNVLVNAEQTAMYAAIDGMVAKTEREKINVFPVYEVNGDVDYKTGNIDFVGTVVIRGNVLTGFRVKAGGDIRIIGGVEGAEIEAEGSVEITGGIMAGNKGAVKAGRNVRCSFIQDGNVFAGEDIIVSQSIMHSNIRAARSVICYGAKGLIVGGSIQAGEKVRARTIGNTLSTATTIEVGVAPELRYELNQLRTQQRQQSENLDKTNKALALLDQMAAAGQLTGEKLLMRSKLATTKRQTMEEIEIVKERILEIEKLLEDTENARVEVINTIYGGTKIVIGRYTRFVKEPCSRVYFKFADGEITMLPLY